MLLPARVASYNEWDPLEEVIVGTPSFAQLPYFDHGMNAVEPGARHQLASLTDRRYPARIIEETEEDLGRFIEALEGLGVTVRRPSPLDFTGTCRTPLWESEYYFQLCPRDVLLAVGDTLIETPNVFRSRYFETLAYRDLLVDYMRAGARWIAAPRPRLEAELYDLSAGGQRALRDLEPAFDAANVLRAGRDILYLVSCSGNELGCRWLQSALGPTYRVFPCRDLYEGTHIDSTLSLLRPGLALVNPQRVTPRNLPEPLRKWEIVAAPPMAEVSYSSLAPLSSVWLGMNLLMVRPDLAVVDADQHRLMRLLERHGIDVLPLRIRHGRTLGGGFHCVTLDVRRKGALEDYA
jgi:glycine amidinotransferase